MSTRELQQIEGAANGRGGGGQVGNSNIQINSEGAGHEYWVNSILR